MGWNAPMTEQEKDELLKRLESSVTALLDSVSVCSAGGGPGVTRLLYTKEWLEAQRAVAAKMTEIGLIAEYDDTGNLFGILPGEHSQQPSVITGSHIDTVVDGGKYDGAYGIAAGLAALEYLKETYGRPKRSLEVVSLCEEEGSRFPIAYWGSGSIAGERSFEDIQGLTDGEGVSFAAAMRECGFGLGRHREPARKNIGSFVELHIEQGGVLEYEGLPVGVVDAIVGQRRFNVTVNGKANHAGTTPMPMRRDALEGAGAMITMLREEAIRLGAPLVATVGRLQVSPNVPNVVPGKAEFTVDVRHSEPERLEAFCSWFTEAFRQAAESRGLEIVCLEWLREEPALMDEKLKGDIAAACGEMGIPFRRMVSGAGHDAQMLSRICPAAMLFVPSRGGVSHSPEEYTSPRGLALGVLVLARLLYRLGYEEDHAS
ncbi:Zn-dependent hydrolase [Paenibacillus nanensis]|uniref:Zn-dependent hydrolase n=1 Tax=Paenibacillus nanensis TaxID=393251 RepID=A0A3A1USL9_9BACL|nr:M20 family metallo-hydrolase [Paenibacillus nanensis]RIX51528.1 Zn-dependent hydrolase [Paenibacillus nanensis]